MQYTVISSSQPTVSRLRIKLCKNLYFLVYMIQFLTSINVFLLRFRTEKNATAWSKDKLKSLFEGLVIEDEKCEYGFYFFSVVSIKDPFLTICYL